MSSAVQQKEAVSTLTISPNKTLRLVTEDGVTEYLAPYALQAVQPYAIHSEDGQTDNCYNALPQYLRIVDGDGQESCRISEGTLRGSSESAAWELHALAENVGRTAGE